MEAHPLQFLFTKALVGPDNATALFRAATREEHRRLALSEQRAWHARFWGVFCAEALHRSGAAMIAQIVRRSPISSRPISSTTRPGSG